MLRRVPAPSCIGTDDLAGTLDTGQPFTDYGVFGAVRRIDGESALLPSEVIPAAGQILPEQMKIEFVVNVHGVFLLSLRSS